MADTALPATELSLDPEDWAQARALGLRMIDDAVRHLATLRDGPVWRPMPDTVRAAFKAELPIKGQPLDEVYDQFLSHILPYAMGNKHPRFVAWYMGGSSLTGALADFLAAIDASNLGGGDTAAHLVDNQVVDWMRQIIGLPAGSSGTLTSGGSVANLIGLTVARNVMAGVDVRLDGVAAIPKPLRYYASDQVHHASDKAMGVLGLGERALRRIPTGLDLRLDIVALERAIAEDRSAGLQPACVIATAGTVNAGSVDDLRAVRALCDREGLWMHVDGCIGALIAMAPGHRDLVAGIERADSVALDPHKWLQAPFDVGCILVRDGTLHRTTFVNHSEYLEERPRGVASAEYLADYGLQLSRGFRALKVWMSLKEQGAARFGQLIDQSIDLAQYLSGLIDSEPLLERIAPTVINIVTFRFNPGHASEAELRALNIEIMLRLQEQGIAAPSDTTVHGQHCLRAAIVNHRTRRDDLDLLVHEVRRLGLEIISQTGGAQSASA